MQGRVNEMLHQIDQHIIHLQKQVAERDDMIAKLIEENRHYKKVKPEIDKAAAKKVIQYSKWKVGNYKEEQRKYGHENEKFYNSRLEENELIIKALEYVIAE